MDNEHITDALIVPHITDALILVECPDCGSPLARVGEKCAGRPTT
jgi:hypothetical protein